MFLWPYHYTTEEDIYIYELFNYDQAENVQVTPGHVPVQSLTYYKIHEAMSTCLAVFVFIGIRRDIL
jgi:hypothetical protein